MQIDAACVDALIALQNIDLQIIRSKKQRAELPQRAKMVEIQKRKADFESKKAQVEAIASKVDAEMEKVGTEDSEIAAKQEKVQELIASAGTDFRSVEAHSKELSGFAKRRNTLGERIDALSGEQAKIASIMAQINAGLAAVEAEENEIKSEFFEKDGELARQIRDFDAQRTELCKGIPQDVMARYEKCALRGNGVALGILEDAKCGVCRSAIEPGRLIELKAHAPLGTCPNCGRMLIVR